jgi:hypothetical protein
MQARQGLSHRARGWLACAALAVASCYHYRASAPQVSNLSEPVSVTKWSYFWGLVQSADEDTSCRCMNNGIKEVTASTNFAYLLLGFVSLGVLLPVELTYVCGKPPVGGKWPDPPRQCKSGNGSGPVLLPVPPGGPPSASPEPTPAPLVSGSAEPGPVTPAPIPSVTPNDPDGGEF